MILVADSGSSKTAWRGLKPDGEIVQWTGAGINPLHLSNKQIQRVLEETFGNMPAQVKEIHFYGAGCVPGEVSKSIGKALSEFFGTPHVSVADDMLAVARGVCGHEEGIACILGTGANSCRYDGVEIVNKIPALGFILGDEGSGAWMGRELLASYFRNELPEDIRGRMESRFDMSRNEVLQEVYRGDRPATYLAGFSKFIFQNKDNRFLHEMVNRGFGLFLEKNVCKYDDHLHIPVHFSGSVAFYYSTILRNACTERGITVKNIVEGPIAGLSLFHRK